jgi:general transcription factor 3C polypeptide 3 (transcription factor C subunit 4)
MAFFCRMEDGSTNKFIHQTRDEKPDCVPPIIISGHRFTALSQHQAAARDYLEAYKLEPENPLINLCVGMSAVIIGYASIYKISTVLLFDLAGTALINLALGFRLQNKNQCIVQGFAFLFKYLHLCENSQVCVISINF